MARVTMRHRMLTCDSRETVFSGENPINISDTVFGFLDEDGSDGSSLESNRLIEDEDENEEEKEAAGNAEDENFWESQRQLLQATICRTTPFESRIRGIAKETLKELANRTDGNICSCRRPVRDGCRSCLMKEVCSRLQEAGFNSAICKSKWKSCPDIPSGEHTFLDVIDNSNPKKGEVRVIIELNFRGEFEMARASEEYNRLVASLPEVFVGKIERLLALIKILCSAAKKCMKEKKMHIGPWRKQRYMQAKWLRTCQRTTSTQSPLSTTHSSRPPRPRASMLTVDLLDMPNLHCPVVAVV